MHSSLQHTHTHNHECCHWPTPAEHIHSITHQVALQKQHMHAHTHTKHTHAHTCTPTAPGLPVAACGRETSWLPTVLPHDNSLSLWLSQPPNAKLFLCEQGASCTLTPPKQHNYVNKKFYTVTDHASFPSASPPTSLMSPTTIKFLTKQQKQVTATVLNETFCDLYFTSTNVLQLWNCDRVVLQL